MINFEERGKRPIWSPAPTPASTQGELTEMSLLANINSFLYKIPKKHGKMHFTLLLLFCPIYPYFLSYQLYFLFVKNYTLLKEISI